ncbi:MAG: Clp protease N-terminal domain-containing protein [Solirubrobacterales bacterium]
MFERFDATSSMVVVQAREEARLLGARRLEAEHLLLALSRQAASDAARLLADVGLDHDGVRDALEAELKRSLQASGVNLSVAGLADRSLPALSQPRWGASSKAAIVRALTTAKGRGDRNIRPTHILLGVLLADEGTVPRALASAGVDGAALVASAEAALGERT